MKIDNIKNKIAKEIGVNREKTHEIKDIEVAISYFNDLANEFLKKKNREFNSNIVREEIIKLIKWAYMEGDELDFTKGILFKGHTGVGKTFLLRVFNYFCMINNLTYYENDKQFTLKVNIVNIKKIAGEFQSPDGGYPVIQRYAYLSCLCIDDIGKEQEESLSFGNKLNVVEEIINIREELGMLTFGTTNIEKMQDNYDDRTVSRMNILFNVIPVNHDIDFRKNK